ncbi:MAG TPA: ferritin-like domain-containing protein [Ignavibacteria bacterium]|nr:ferritin-like domain-containing protein [Ignavibacteria bacterium]
MSKLKTLEDFFIEELKDIYSAEKQIEKALPKMVKAAESEELKKAFEDHLGETKMQIERLEAISGNIGKKLSGKKCKAMEGLLEEGKEVIEENAVPSVKDAALIAAAQKVEHYEMASYGCVVTYARLLNNNKVEALLQQTLNEEGNADKILTGISKKINLQALTGSEAA